MRLRRDWSLPGAPWLERRRLLSLRMDEALVDEAGGPGAQYGSWIVEGAHRPSVTVETST